jgi:ubiquinone/menaquinone biosynthesis C-methylase UbiE
MDKQLKFYEALADSYRFLPEDDAAEIGRVTLVKYLMGFTKDISSALDLGCGEGYLCSLYKQWGINFVVGADSAINRIGFGKKRFAGSNYVQSNILSNSISSKSFDIVSAVEVLEHIEDVEQCIKEMVRLSKKYVLITVPNEGKIVKTVCPQCLHRFEPAGHLHSFSKDNLTEMCSKYIDIIKITDNYWINHPFLKELVLPIMKKVRTDKLYKGNYIGIIGTVK